MGTTPTAKSTTSPADEIIDVSEVVVAPRGRKAELDSDLTATFAKLPAGKAVRLASKFGSLTTKEAKAKAGQTIRKNWRAVRSEDVRISFGTDGVPQVMVRPEKAK